MSRPELAYLARVLSTPKYYVTGLVHEMQDKEVFLFAQAIAFKVLVTIVPIIILVVGVVTSDRVLGGETTLHEIQGIVSNFLPAYESDQVMIFFERLLSASPDLQIIGAVGLLVTAMTLVTTVRIAVANAFEQTWHEDRPLLLGYLFDLRMVLQVGFFFTLTLVLTFMAQAISAEAMWVFGTWGLRLLELGWQQVITVIGYLLPFLITTAMFFQLYFFIPKPKPPKTSALIGAFIAGALWEIAKYGFTLYATYVARFDRYGREDGFLAEDGVAALGNSFGLLIAFVFWVYYSGIVLLLGALIASLHEKHRRTQEADEKDMHEHPDTKLEAASHQEPADNHESDGEEDKPQPEPSEPPGRKSED